MFVIYIVLFLISCYLSKRKSGQLFGPLFIIGLTWNLFPAISCLGLLGMNPPVFEVHCLIVLAWFSFTIGFFSPVRFVVRGSTGNFYKQGVVNSKIVLVGSIIVFFYLLPHLFVSWSYIGIEGWASLRTNAGALFSESTVDNIINTWFVDSFIVASSTYLAISLCTRKRLPIALYILIVANVLISCVVFAGRALLVKIIFFIAFSFFFVYGKKINRMLLKKRKLVMLLILAGLIVAVVFITSNRMSERAGSNFLNSALPYYIGPFSLITYYWENKSISLIGSNYLFGSAFFGFIYNIVRAALYTVFNLPYNGSDYILCLVTALNRPIGGNNYINAACTALYPMLRDFGVFGVFAGFLIIGLIFGALEKTRLENVFSERFAMIYTFLYYVLFKLEMNYEPINPAFFFTIIYIFVLCIGGKDRENENIP